MKFNKPTLVTLTAPTCSGKTYLIEHLASLGFKRIVGFTTRDPREGEVEGVDYNFITVEEAVRLKAAGQLAETAEFRGNHYGVTNQEMEGKMVDGDFPPVVILEPTGLASYEKYCVEKGWNIFKIYVTVPEKTKLDRLNKRTVQDIASAQKKFDASYLDCFGYNIQRQVLETIDPAVIEKIIATHTSRLLSITGDERTWLMKAKWEAIVPGDDLTKAISYIEQGIKWQNSLNVAPTT